MSNFCGEVLDQMAMSGGSGVGSAEGSLIVHDNKREHVDSTSQLWSTSTTAGQEKHALVISSPFIHHPRPSALSRAPETRSVSSVVGQVGFALHLLAFGIPTHVYLSSLLAIVPGVPSCLHHLFLISSERYRTSISRPHRCLGRSPHPAQSSRKRLRDHGPFQRMLCLTLSVHSLTSIPDWFLVVRCTHLYRRQCGSVLSPCSPLTYALGLETGPSQASTKQFLCKSAPPSKAWSVLPHFFHRRVPRA